MKIAAGKSFHKFAALGFSILLTALSLIAAELFVRWLDGYQVFSAKLIAPQSKPASSAAPLVERIPIAEGMNREWFQRSPPPVSGDAKPLPDLQAVIARYVAAGVGSESTHVFSRGFAEQEFCKSGPLSQVGSVFLFDPPDGGRYPRYRFPLNAILPSGLHTNQFGWRGSPIALAKPLRTIRVAFVGASTTVNYHNFPFSYPELAVYWLNEWVKALKLDVAIELIHAGREGVTSTDMAATVRDEVLPLEPDLVVYYEGSNQIRPGDIEKFPEGIISHYKTWRAPRFRQSISDAAVYSAILLRIVEAMGDTGVVSEPAKPAYEVVWPKDVNEFDPPLDHPHLPSNLTTILNDLDDIRSHVKDQGGELVVSSFFWLVYDGMKFDLPVQKGVYNYLNGTFFPHRYREMERIATFQNRVFQKFARTHGLPFIDIASAMPREPDLFDDAIHAKYEGVRLHGWIAAQQLAPILLERIKTGALPRPARLKLERHPGFPANERTATFDCQDGVFKVKRTWDGIVAPSADGPRNAEADRSNRMTN